MPRQGWYGGQPPWGFFSAADPWRNTHPIPGWGRALLGSEGGRPGTEGDLFIGKKAAPLTGGWVYGLHPWYPGSVRRENPYTGKPEPARNA